ncbi:MAG TPA: ATP-binding protein [Rhizomicrobium sp.]|jgi:two-component system cell cycle sensor histidine kinase PleC|nr:ATP-binding protein [Rhizomicrobium sp.]
MTLTGKTIGAKIFAAFVAMSLIIGASGLAGYGVLSVAGDIAVTTFDGPLMAISYARAAHTDFTEMQLAEQRYEHADSAHKRVAAEEIGELADTFTADLDVAAERSLAQDEQKIIKDIRPLVARWRAARAKGDIAVLESLDRQIDGKFDMLIELNTDHSFVGRRIAVTNIARYKNVSVAITVLALLLATAITFYLKNAIVRPLSAAARVADRIAAGQLQTAIPAGGEDETGALLKSMTVMQDNIRRMMDREQALRRSAETRLVDALETSREGVMLVAADGCVVMANSTLRDFFPAVRERLTPGVAFDAALALIQGQLAATQAPSRDLNSSGHAELELADGRWLRMTVSATSEGGSIIFLSDFTAIKEREETLRRAKQEAEAANASKTRFLANMSHELRTPLNAIIGFSEIISGQYFGGLGNERYLDYSHDILRSGRHLLAVINDVLDLSKSESGKMSLALADIDMRDLLDDCIAMVREQCAEAGLALRLEGMEGDLSLRADAAKLRQIFLNLLSNAIKFTEKGGTILLSASAVPDAVSVTVGDTGIGMDPEDVEVAFQPFRQIDNRLERRYEGAGLGLPLTKALADLHGASIAVDSARGRGTRITVTFPRPAAQALLAAG